MMESPIFQIEQRIGQFVARGGEDGPLPIGQGGAHASHHALEIGPVIGQDPLESAFGFFEQRVGLNGFASADVVVAAAAGDRRRETGRGGTLVGRRQRLLLRGFV